jgi:hypothetical protein
MLDLTNIFDKPEAGLGAGFSGRKHALDVGVIAGQWIWRSGDHQCHPRADHRPGRTDCLDALTDARQSGQSGNRHRAAT